ncbi:MAG: molybdopterin molybdotransferase MoeA [Planctomycetia bacterium]|nr:molybdopterin molybdotransferase MoeA [Planctomycetia bacterium]
MLSIDDALARVLSAARPKPDEPASLADAAGRVLAEDVASDVDSPPHDKSLVDGYAVRSADFRVRPNSDPPAPVELAVVEEVTAGMVPTVQVTAGRATRIMTGAPIPAGADIVVMVEETHWHAEPGVPGGVVRVELSKGNPQPGHNIMPRASSIRRGQVVLRAGTLLRSAEIGLLAEVGRRQVRVAGRPRVAVLPTGNELVDASIVPAPGQIRNSNGPMLLAAAAGHGAIAIDLGVARDDREQLRIKISEGLRADVLLLCGGVSAGVLDLVPETLQSLGVREQFHKVAIKPGKPLWFGTYEGPAGQTLVFGLPGNPASVVLCFELFVMPALDRIAGREPRLVPLQNAQLADAYDHRGPRTTYHPARLRNEGQTAIVETVAWHGSGDLRALGEANAWAVFPPGDRHYAVGEIVSCRLMVS